jgi:hypothetical protein
MRPPVFGIAIGLDLIMAGLAFLVLRQMRRTWLRAQGRVLAVGK